jgi:hypothetical protein
LEDKKDLTNTVLNIQPLTIKGKTATSVKKNLKALTKPLSDKVRPRIHSEIAWIVRQLIPRKAAGPDGIQNIILKYL